MRDLPLVLSPTLHLTWRCSPSRLAWILHALGHLELILKSPCSFFPPLEVAEACAHSRRITMMLPRPTATRAAAVVAAAVVAGVASMAVFVGLRRKRERVEDKKVQSLKITRSPSLATTSVLWP